MVFVFVAYILNTWFILNGNNRLHHKMLGTISNAPINTFFDVVPTGRIVNRFSKDFNNLDNDLTSSAEQMLQNMVAAIGTFVVCVIAVPIVGLTLPLLIAACYYLNRYVLRSSRESARLNNITYSSLVQNINDAYEGATVIRCFGSAQHFRQKNIKLINDNCKPTLFSVLCSAYNSVYMRLFCVLFGAVFTTVIVVWKNSYSSGFASLVMFYSTFNTPVFVFWMLYNFFVLENTLVSVERCIFYSKMPVEAKSTYMPTGWPSNGKIAFSHYSMSYRPNLPLALNNINLSVQPNERVGIVGRTGSGKSSLTMALMRIVESNVGYISIDNVDISKINIKFLRKNITIISQDSLIFEGTLRQNIDPLNMYTDAQIQNTLQKVEFPNSKGLNFQVEANGANISKGEKQLISLARALLKRSIIISR
jgi:ABC-type multidrug transport system fused ATPase/permease subunit